MTIESLRLFRNILYRAAAVSYAILILSALIWLPFSEMWTGLTCNWYHITPDRVHNIVVDYLSIAKFYTIFLLLVPALALHWTIKTSGVRSSGNDQ